MNHDFIAANKKNTSLQRAVYKNLKLSVLIKKSLSRDIVPLNKFFVPTDITVSPACTLIRTAGNIFVRIRKRTEVDNFPLIISLLAATEDFFDQNHPDWFREPSHFSKIRHTSDEWREA